MKEIERINRVVSLLNDVICLQLKFNGKISKDVQFYCDYYYIYLSKLESKIKWEISKIKY